MRALVRMAALGLAPFLFFILMIAPGLLLVPFTLLAGWWPAGARLLEAWHPERSAVVLFGLALLVLLAGSHAFLRWLFGQLRARENGAATSQWPWKGTLCGFGILACTLLAIGSLVLATHQLYWLAKSSEPMLSDPRREKLGVFRAVTELKLTAEEARWESVRTREAFCKRISLGPGRPAPEFLQPVWVEQDAQHLQAIILIPRRPLHRRTASLVVLQPGTNLVWHHLEELPKVLASFGLGEPAPAAVPSPSR